MAEDEFTALLWGAAHAARVGILCNGFAARLVGGHGASADSIVVQCKCKGCASCSPSRAPEGNLFTLDLWAAHCGAITEPLRLSVFSVVQAGDPKARVPLLDWLNLANEAMGGESLHRRQLCVLFPGADEEEGTPYHWRAGTIRHIDPVTGAAEVKYHDDRRKRSKAHLYLPLAVMHWARCPPPPETPPRTVAEGCQPLPRLLLPGVPLPRRPAPQPASSDASSPPSSPQQQPDAAKPAAVPTATMAATAAHTVNMELVASSAPPFAAKDRSAVVVAPVPAATVHPKPKPESESFRPTGPAPKPASSASRSAVSLSLLAAAAAADAAAAAGAAAALSKPGPMRRYTKRPHGGADGGNQAPPSQAPPANKEQKRRDGAAPGEGRPWAAADACCPRVAAAASTAAAVTVEVVAAAAPAPAVGSWAASAREGGASSHHSHHSAANDAAGGDCRSGRGSACGLPPSWSSAELNNNSQQPAAAPKPNCQVALSAPAWTITATTAAIAQQASQLQVPQQQQQQELQQQQQELQQQQQQLVLGGMAAVPSLSTFSSSSTDLESLLNDDDDAFDSTADGSTAAAVDEFAALTAAVGACGAGSGGTAARDNNNIIYYSSSGTESDSGRCHGGGLTYGGGGSGVFVVQQQQQQQPPRDGNARSPSLVPSMGAVSAPEPQLLQVVAPAPAPAFLPVAQPSAVTAAPTFASGSASCNFAPTEWQQPTRTSYSGLVPAPPQPYNTMAASASAAASAAAASVAAAAAESLAAVAGNYTMRVYWEHYYSLMGSRQVVPSTSPTPAPMLLPQLSELLSPCAATERSSSCGNGFGWRLPASVPLPAMPPQHLQQLVSSDSGIFCAPSSVVGGNACAMPAAPPLPLPPAAADENVADAGLRILLSEIEELQWPLPQPTSV
ncbi:hypothetical protein HYH02_006509 [Chlamydomonas schloesseri]|uniref:Uncharacterized protein n=1 Tax=Chlamydomonas schloesseri TaxID=2026947 RepID=A0A835WKS2_9CHLO|nr:hypothetical protein HYH02_006509 [Chlamydomonas schloesseri]|eukprot:KAG2448620.1 hypothetical protein HYH02_006509 [Chlamydomonas schloesseri]